MVVGRYSSYALRCQVPSSFVAVDRDLVSRHSFPSCRRAMVLKSGSTIRPPFACRANASIASSMAVRSGSEASGLGLEAQRQAVASYLNGVDVRFADLPQIEGPTGRFMLQQMASVAELEAGLISSRTKSALAAAKARGVKLGGNRGAIISTEARATGRAVQAVRSKARATDLPPILAELRNAGVTTLAGIARALSDRRIPTARGVSGWTPTQVSRRDRVRCRAGRAADRAVAGTAGPQATQEERR
jgi:Resolvase, N terminal domain